jgi:hypothetical protein
MLKWYLNAFASYLICFLLLQRNLFAGTTPPTTTHTLTPATPNGENSWYITPVQVKLTASDLESGVKEINYQIDNGTWKKVSFSSSLNQAPNPSFEIPGTTTSGLDKWEATVISGATYSQDTTVYYPGYETSSAKIDASGGGWHGINHKNNFVVAKYLDNMTAGAWLRSPSTTGQSRFRIYAVNASGVVTEIAQSSLVVGKTDWTYISLNFTVSMSDAIGIYMDVGIIGNGILWADAVSINSSNVDTSASFVVGSDSTSHDINYYSVDYAGNIETIHTFTFKIDQTPPGNWRDSGAFRSVLGPSDHHLYVYATVDDQVSGLSSDTNKYQYLPEAESTFGIHEDLMQCSSDWFANSWAALLSAAITPGVLTADLMTPKTDLCNSNWKICKTVRFYAKDMAGNTTTKDFCVNGPWIKIRGGAFVRSNQNISMVAEGEGYNTDGLIEAAGNIIDFFTSSKGWKVTMSDIPNTLSFSELYDAIPTKTLISNGTLGTTTGVYEINGDVELKNTNVPSGFNSGTFDQVIFVNGNLKFSTDVIVSNTSTALFVVSGNVEIDKGVDEIGVAMIAEGNIYTAYNVQEGQTAGTLLMKGLFSANKFYFQRTLQGTGNEEDPSEDITFDPRYLVKLRDHFGGSTVKWLGTE